MILSLLWHPKVYVLDSNSDQQKCSTRKTADNRLNTVNSQTM